MLSILLVYNADSVNFNFADTTHLQFDDDFFLKVLHSGLAANTLECSTTFVPEIKVLGKS